MGYIIYEGKDANGTVVDLTQPYIVYAPTPLYIENTAAGGTPLRGLLMPSSILSAGIPTSAALDAPTMPLDIIRPPIATLIRGWFYIVGAGPAGQTSVIKVQAEETTIVLSVMDGFHRAFLLDKDDPAQVTVTKLADQSTQVWSINGYNATSTKDDQFTEISEDPHAPLTSPATLDQLLFGTYIRLEALKACAAGAALPDTKIFIELLRGQQSRNRGSSGSRRAD